MPRIEDWLLDSVIYLYPSEAAAVAGERTGGSGFLVGVPSSTRDGVEFLYAVTNEHVARGAPVIRFNNLAGATDVQPLGPDSWTRHPDGDDVTVALLGAVPKDLDKTGYKYTYVRRDTFVAQEDIARSPQYGPGDDVFFLGRFITHEGRQRNLPTARFGNIAQLPHEPVRQPQRGINQESFLVEARSLSGYSGSPVFVYRMSYGAVLGAPQGVAQPKLLGVDWGHACDTATLLDPVTNDPVGRVQQNSGLMMVVPAWKLAELLDSEELVEQQDRMDEETAKDSEGIAMDATASEFSRFEDLSRRLLAVPKEELDAKLREEKERS